MYFQIREIILWPKDRSLQPRRLPFELGSVNVISGVSKTGKSAIIPIIDYCLGAKSCTIPVNTIRNYCEWFGVVIQTSTGQKLFARREPGSLKATGDMYVSEDIEVRIPEMIESKNTNVNAVKKSLDELVGLTTLSFDSEELNVGFTHRPSFRDLGAFNFQPQNIIANPDVFFYKADTYEHREKLRTIFPYVLNAITSKLLAKQHELTQLQKELKRKQNELDSIRQVSTRWIAEIQSKISEARELGLIKEPVSPNASREELIEILDNVVKTSTDEIRVTEETVSEAIDELLNLQKEESDTSLELSVLRKRYIEMSTLKESSKQYQDALQVQIDRLKISEWLGKTHDPDHNCPLCGNSLELATEQLNALYNSLQEIEKTSGEFNSIPAAFDREYERVRAEIRNITEKLQGIRIRRQSLENSSEEAKQRQYDTLKVSRFIGNLEQSLETYFSIGRDSELSQEIQEIQDRVNELEGEISEAQIRSRTKRALNTINLNAGKLLPRLDAERPNDPVSLSINDLTVRIQGVDREDYLWEIGSGSNWLAYHIAVSLGLHQYFLTLPNSSVPTFIVYDQPSQVYFPRQLVTRKEEAEFDPEFKDEDLEAIRKVFRVLSSVVKDSDGKFQIIVLDHAADNVWGNIEDINLVEEWRRGRKLVPIEWIKKE